jgi:hypothetical protein
MYYMSHEAELNDVEAGTDGSLKQVSTILKELYAEFATLADRMDSQGGDALQLWQSELARQFASCARLIVLLMLHEPASHVRIGLDLGIPARAVNLLGKSLSALRPHAGELGLCTADVALPQWCTYLFIYLDSFGRHMREVHLLAATRVKALADPRRHIWQSCSATADSPWSQPAWRDYSDEEQRLLEQAFRTGQASVRIHPGESDEVVVDFEAMRDRRPASDRGAASRRTMLSGSRQIDERRVQRVPKVSGGEEAEAAAIAAASAIEAVAQRIASTDQDHLEISTWPIASDEDQAAAADTGVQDVVTVHIPPLQLPTTLRVRLSKLSVAWLKVRLDSNTLHAVLRSLIGLTRDYKLGVLVAQTGGLQSLLSLRQSDSFPGLHVAVMLIMRHACEDAKTLQYMMESEILGEYELFNTLSLRKFVYKKCHALARNEESFVAACHNTLELLEPSTEDPGSASITLRAEAEPSFSEHTNSGMHAVLSEVTRILEVRWTQMQSPEAKAKLEETCMVTPNRDEGLVVAPVWKPPAPLPTDVPPVDPALAQPIFDIPRLLQVMSELAQSYPALAAQMCKQTVKVSTTGGRPSQAVMEEMPLPAFLLHHGVLYAARSSHKPGSVGEKQASLIKTQARRLLVTLAKSGKAAIESVWVLSFKAAFERTSDPAATLSSSNQQRLLAEVLKDVLVEEEAINRTKPTLVTALMDSGVHELLVDVLLARDINDPAFKDDVEVVMKPLVILMRLAQRAHLNAKAAEAEAAEQAERSAREAEQGHGDDDANSDSPSTLASFYGEGLEDLLLRAFGEDEAEDDDMGSAGGDDEGDADEDDGESSEDNSDMGGDEEGAL